MASLKLPVVSGRDAVKALEKAGWQVKRWKNHIVLTKPGSLVSLSVPDHEELAKGTLRRILKQAELTVEEFNELLK